MNDDPAVLFQGEMQHGILGEAPVEVATIAEAAASLPDEVPTPAAPPAERPVTLTDVARDFAMFTHSAFFTYGGMPAGMDPLTEFALINDCMDKIGFFDFPAPIFRGVARNPEQARFDHRLYFAAHAIWPGLCAWLSAAAPVDHEGRRYHKARPSVIRVVDRLAVESMAVLPGIPVVHVTAFGLTGNVHNVRFRPGLKAPGSVAYVDRMPLEKAALREAGRVLGRHKDPILAGCR